MIKTLKTAAETRVRIADRRRQSSQILAAIALGSAMLLCFANARAQELSSRDFGSAPAVQIGSGWWTAETAKSKPAPHLLDIEALYNFVGHNGLGVSSAPAERYLPAKYNSNLKLVESGSLVPESFLSVIQTDYQLWESSLAETRSPIAINGGSAYPLIQVDYRGVSLPISLYVPALRGTERINGIGQ